MSPEEEKESPEREFAGNTPLHGLNRIVIAPSGYFRVLWVLAILSSYSGFAYMFSTMIIDYFSYNTITDTKLEFDDEVIFPAVTVCNMNKFDEGKLKVIDFVYLSMFLFAVQLDADTIIAGGAIPDETVNSTTEDEYTETYTASGNAEVGLKLLVHDPREPPMMDTQGIALAPGNHAFVSVKRILYENHVPPWGVCEDRQLEYYDTYTLNGCYLECRSKHVVRNCSCRPYNLPGTAPTCDPSTMFTCVNDVLDQVIRGELKCDCPVPCKMTSYSTSVLYAGWPNRHTRTYLAPYWGMDSNYITTNGVVFSVFYEKLNYQKITELKAMDGGQLASNIGGMMGLFIGASLLTLLEVWEYLWQRLKGFLSKHRRPTVIDVKTQPHDIERGIVFHK
ncbi:acid-sensing ion channel 1C-like [Branchiostoma floridae x Branchiostoma japonicum]